MKTLTRINLTEAIYEEIGLSRKDSGDIIDMVIICFAIHGLQSHSVTAKEGYTCGSWMVHCVVIDFYIVTFKYVHDNTADILKKAVIYIYVFAGVKGYGAVAALADIYIFESDIFTIV